MVMQGGLRGAEWAPAPPCDPSLPRQHGWWHGAVGTPQPVLLWVLRGGRGGLQAQPRGAAGGGDALKPPPTVQEASGVKLSTGSPLQLVTPRRHWGRDGKLSPAVGGPPPPWAPCVTPGGAGQALQELLCPTAVRVTAPAPCRASCDSPSPGSCPALLTRSLPWGRAAPRAELPAPCVTVRAEGVTVRRKHPLETYAVTKFFHR